MSAEIFDFRKPPPTTLELKTTQWFNELCGITPRIWAKILTFDAELKVERATSMSGGMALEMLPNNAVAFRLKVDTHPECFPVLALGRPLLLAIINGSIGSPGTELPADRDLSTVEKSVCDFLVGQLFVNLLGDAWPASSHPKFTIDVRGEPRGVCTLPPNDLVILGQFTLSAGFGEHPIYMMMPRSAPLTELVKPAVDPVAVKAIPREQIEAVVGELNVDFAVLLGNTQVTLLQLALLKPDDVIVLGQKVSDPLPAKVGGKDKFNVWPGAVGRRQAVQIDSMIEK